MKKNNILTGIALGALALLTAAGISSCSDLLDLGPIDHYGSQNYWKTPEQARSYIVGIHQHMRGQDWQHMMTYGELGGGSFKNASTSSDAMTLAAGDIRLHNLGEEHSGVSKFGDLFGRITNLNLFITRVDDCGLDEAEKSYYLGMVYGLRAYYYFELHKMYGGVPIRLGVEVIEGERDPQKLYTERKSPKEVLDQVRSDIAKSLEYFGDRNGFSYYGFPAKAFWNKAATECLAADVALWSAKVSTFNAKADPSQIAVAKKHLTSVLTNYGLSLQPSFGAIFDTGNKANSEVIFASRYIEGEASTGANSFMYDLNTGQAQHQILEDGSPFGNPFQISGGVQYYQYDDNLFLSYDKEDTRRNVTFLPVYDRKVYEDTGEMKLWGTFLAKNIGHINAEGNRVFDGDIIYYRLAWVYLALAEVVNYEGDYAKVAEYINTVRARAYGDNWDAAIYGYTAGDFTQNELAILREKDKEFVNEGQRWWDLRRMQYTKGGEHLVFRDEASFYHGHKELDPATEAHEVLWPIDKSLLNNDPKLVQTPGYTSGVRDYDGSWE